MDWVRCEIVERSLKKVQGLQEEGPQIQGRPRIMDAMEKEKQPTRIKERVEMYRKDLATETLQYPKLFDSCEGIDPCFAFC